MQALIFFQETKPLQLKVFTPEGQFLEISIASTNREMTVREACILIATRLGLFRVTPELHIITENQSLNIKGENKMTQI